MRRNVDVPCSIGGINPTKGFNTHEIEPKGRRAELAWGLLYEQGMKDAPQKALENAQSLITSGEYGEAADAFQVLFDKQPDSPELLVALADAMAHLGQTDSSLALLADSINESDPDKTTLLRISEQLREVGRFEESADFLLCALSCSPEDLSVRSKTENALTALGRTAQLEWLKAGAAGDMPSA
jgi:Flp pilus assembly protein TadD